MISVEQAQQLVLALAVRTATEEIALARACGRQMAAPAKARRDQPPFDCSAMDGYAISGDAVVGQVFSVRGESGAGHGYAGSIGNDEAVRIFTGAPVPDGATRVILQEDVTRVGNQIMVEMASTDNSNIRRRGNDFAAGAVVEPRRLSPNDLALLAAMNVATVTVARKPVVALIATGDELVMPGEDPGPDQIIASNTFALKALVEKAGGVARMLPIARDTETDLRAVLAISLDADVIVTVGGASVGDHDLVGRVASDMGLERAFHKIAMRPGKPLMAGRLNAKPMLGLPGNPVSAIVCGHLFMMPLIRAMSGDHAPLPTPLRAILGQDVKPTGPRTHYMRARLEPADGLPVITAFADQDSALLGVLAASHALLIRPKDDGARTAGEMVSYLAI
jgi:molybdopterin molybdotransferase